jgi:hypothetical protein
MSRPWQVMTSDTLKATTKYEVWLRVGHIYVRFKKWYVKVNGINHCIVLYDLPHFEVCIIFHNFYQVWTLNNLVLANSPCQEGPLKYGLKWTSMSPLRQP